MSVILPGAIIEEGVLIAAHSCLKGVAEKDSVYAGTPAKKICETSRIKLTDNSGKSAYPWRKHFHRDYPSDVIKGWIED